MFDTLISILLEATFLLEKKCCDKANYQKTRIKDVMSSSESL